MPHETHSTPKRYSVYGLTIETAEDFDGLLLPSSGPIDLHYDVAQAPYPSEWDPQQAVYESPQRDDDGMPFRVVWHRPNVDRILITGIAAYDVTNRSIVCYPRPGVSETITSIHLLGSVMALWLERTHTPALHASAVVVGGSAAAFLSSTAGGKSTLAAALMEAGHPLLTDDILAVERRDAGFVARSAYPQMRLWPGEARRFLGRYGALERVHPAISKRRVPVGSGGFGTFCESRTPLVCIYIPRRRAPSDQNARIDFHRVKLSDAMIELVRHSFLAPVVEALGLQRQRLACLRNMVMSIPVRQIEYPCSLRFVSRLREAILADLVDLQNPRARDIERDGQSGEAHEPDITEHGSPAYS